MAHGGPDCSIDVKDDDGMTAEERKDMTQGFKQALGLGLGLGLGLLCQHHPFRSQQYQHLVTYSSRSILILDCSGSQVIFHLPAQRKTNILIMARHLTRQPSIRYLVLLLCNLRPSLQQSARKQQHYLST